MSTTSEPHLACHHTGYEFDWWRCNEGGYVGRPPSPFPAPFETPRGYRPDSSDSRYEIRTPAVAAGNDTNGVAGVGTNGAINADYTNDAWGCCSGTDDARRLYWPLYQGPGDTEPVQAEDFGNIDSSAPNKKSKLTPRLPHKRPPWIPTKMPNKWGVAGHPPPYTNYCKETLFNTRTANPAKVAIKTTF